MTRLNLEQHRQLGDLLILPAALNDDTSGKQYGRLVYALGGLMTGLLVWSGFAQIREIAAAPGTVISGSYVQPVHHLEGGIVEDVLASEGEEILAGQPVLRLRPHAAESDLEQIKSQKAQLTLRHIRLNASIANAKPDFGILAKQYPDLAKEQLELLTDERAGYEAEKNKIELQIAQLYGETETAMGELESAKRQIVIEREQIGIREASFNKGYTSRVNFLEAKSKLETTTARRSQAEGQIAKLEHQSGEARHELRKIEAVRLQKLAEEKAKIAGELDEISNTLRKQQDKVQRLIVQAPATGIINLMPHKSIGAVVKPGDLIAEIVSLQTGILVEAQLQPKDLGHVKVGDKVEIKISNFDPSTVGVAHGKVVDISPTTFQSKESVNYYRTRIQVNERELRNGAEVWKLLPGMVVEANIVTGSKSLLRYMMKPLYSSLSKAFVER